jgi:hypothetical protein
MGAITTRCLSAHWPILAGVATVATVATVMFDMGLSESQRGLIAEMLKWMSMISETPAFSARHWDPSPAVKIARMLLMESVDLDVVFRKLLNNDIGRI